MAMIPCRSVFFPLRADCTAYRGQRGDVVTSEANDFVGIVQSPGAAPVEIEPTPYTPATDNATDLGSPALRFRSLYLGTTLAVGDAAGGQALLINQPAANQGDFIPGSANAGLRLVGGAGHPNGGRLSTAAAGGTVVFEAFGTDADIGLTIAAKGTDPLILGGAATSRVSVGGDAASLVGFYGATPIAQAAAQLNLTLTVAGDMPGPTPAEITTRLNLIENKVNAMLVAQRTSTGIGIFAG